MIRNEIIPQNHFQIKAVPSIYEKSDDPDSKERKNAKYMSFQMQKHNYKQEPNQQLLGKVCLPENNMILTHQQELLNGTQKKIPIYQIDFGKQINVRVPTEMKLEKLQVINIQNNCRLYEGLLQQWDLIKEKQYYPVFFQQNTIVGLLRVQRKVAQDTNYLKIDLIFYMWNFLKLGEMYEELKNIKLQQKQVKLHNEMLYKKLINYINEMPQYYWQPFEKILQEFRQKQMIENVNSYQFSNSQDYFMLRQYKFTSQKNQRDKLEMEHQNMKKIHQMRKALCCYREIDIPQKINHDQLIIQSCLQEKGKIYYDSMQNPKDLGVQKIKNHTLANQILDSKKHLFINSYNYSYPIYKLSEGCMQNNQQNQKDPYTSDDEITYVYERQSLCGNPYSIVRRPLNKINSQIQDNFSEDSYMQSGQKEYGKEKVIAIVQSPKKQREAFKKKQQQKLEQKLQQKNQVILDNIDKQQLLDDLSESIQNEESTLSQNIQEIQITKNEEPKVQEQNNLIEIQDDDNDDEEYQIQENETYTVDDLSSDLNLNKLLTDQQTQHYQESSKQEKGPTAREFEEMFDINNDEQQSGNENQYTISDSNDEDEANLSKQNSYDSNSQQQKGFKRDGIYQDKVANLQDEGTKVYFNIKNMVYEKEHMITYFTQNQDFFKNFIGNYTINDRKTIQQILKEKKQEIESQELQYKGDNLHKLFKNKITNLINIPKITKEYYKQKEESEKKQIKDQKNQQQKEQQLLKSIQIQKKQNKGNSASLMSQINSNK